MPIYHGCPRIEEYFPPASMIRIDIGDPDAVAQVRGAIAGDRWKRNLDAIAEARRLVLERYQFFPFMSSEIQRIRAAAPPPPRERIVIPGGARMSGFVRFTPLARAGPRRALVAAHARAYGIWRKLRS
jgi:hypothetical protein